MSPALPLGDPAPRSGALPTESLDAMGQRDFGLYLHVPFCRVRCGYCDFNTYTAKELGSGGADVHSYVDAALAEMDLAAAVLGASGRPAPQLKTVFVGGGTPTLLAATDLARVVTAAQGHWSPAPDVEITTEANPDTLTPTVAHALALAGYTRVSIGMQSAVPSVLATLDRTHDPAGVAAAVAAVRGAGMQVSLDLIYGTPGESLHQWRLSLQAAMDLQPDHVSAYALTIEPGTAMAAAVRRGTLPMPSDDDEADKYELLDSMLSTAGYQWYEISNWATDPSRRCRHNVAYWSGANWWGIGPGAHSHIGGTRWWNVKHPAAYAERIANGASPAHSREVLTQTQRHDEAVLLGIRLSDGLDFAVLSPAGRRAIAALIAEGLLHAPAAIHERAMLTRRGRLLADTVVHRLLAGA